MRRERGTILKPDKVSTLASGWNLEGRCELTVPAAGSS